jgi:hypothetical protein
MYPLIVPDEQHIVVDDRMRGARRAAEAAARHRLSADGRRTAGVLGGARLAAAGALIALGGRIAGVEPVELNPSPCEDSARVG